MATRVYEGLFLLDSNRYARDSKGVSGQIDEMITKCGGEVLVSRLWNEQRLAYPIKGNRKGTYWLTYFRMESSGVSQLNRQGQLNSNILRSLVISVDERLVDALVQHASGKVTSTSDSDADSKAKIPATESTDDTKKDAEPAASAP